MTTFNWITSNNSINLNTLIRIVNHSLTFKIKLIKFPFLFRPDNSSLDHHLSNLSLTSIRSPNTTAIDRLQPEIISNPFVCNGPTSFLSPLFLPPTRRMTIFHGNRSDFYQVSTNNETPPAATSLANITGALYSRITNHPAYYNTPATATNISGSQPFGLFEAGDSSISSYSIDAPGQSGGGGTFSGPGIEGAIVETHKEFVFDRTDVRIVFITLYSLVFCCCFFGESRRLSLRINFLSCLLLFIYLNLMEEKVEETNNHAFSLF